MTRQILGQQAEETASNWLLANGFTVIALNWTNNLSEIDVVCRKERTIYCIEVRYRSSDEQGGGLDSITSSKYNQMKRAAYMYVFELQLEAPIELGIVIITGDKAEIVENVVLPLDL